MNRKKNFLYSLKITGIIIFILHLSFFLVTGFSIFMFKMKNPETTAIMNYRKEKNGITLRKPGFIPLRAIPADIISSVIFIEDFEFYYHHGIDIESIRFALEINKKMGYLAYGGSTLTQQLARTLFLNPGKNYIRKYLEILIALEMELILSKERILELYFNYAEWGNDIYGISDAAEFYYHKPLHTLKNSEKLSLITILASPIKYTPYTFHTNRILVARHRALWTFFELLKKIPPRFKSTIREKG